MIGLAVVSKRFSCFRRATSWPDFWKSIQWWEKTQPEDSIQVEENNTTKRPQVSFHADPMTVFGLATIVSHEPTSKAAMA